jgi:three-Cys-motif partner protein
VTSAPRTTLWPLDPHTRAKHEILRHYLDAWIPILSLGKFPKLVYIDGFAGPGRYSKGEDGSPILAVKAVLAQRVVITAHLEFYFVEKEADRSLHLESLLREIPLPRNLTCSVLTALFEEAYSSTIKPHLERIPRAPVFAFLDPFGYTGIPLSVIRELLQRASAEVLVTFMYEEINRFALVDGQATHMDQLFGTNEWRGIAALEGVEKRRSFFERLYARQLRTCTRFVRSFEMRNKKDATDYFLFYATSHPLGLAKMKEAMWRVDPGGEFTFSDASDPNQAVLFSGEPDYEMLGNVIHVSFRGQVATVKDVESFVVEQTAFTTSHYKKALKSLESSTPSRVQPVDAPPKRRRGTYPDENLRLRFV